MARDDLNDKRNDATAGLVQDLLDHLEGAGPSPNLSHLGHRERQWTEALLASMRAARDFDPDTGPPQLEQLWADVLPQAAATPIADLVDAEIPNAAGVYCWWHGDEPLFVNAADDLRHELLHVQGTEPDRSQRQFRTTVEHRLRTLEELQGRERRRRRDRSKAVDAFIGDCAVSWITTGSPTRARSVASKAREQLLGHTEAWTGRVGQPGLLRAYIESLPSLGRLHFEVPVGGDSGGRPSRIAAVRLPTLSGEPAFYTAADFQRDLQQTSEVEVIEVARTLNRVIVGQLLVARDLAATEWALPTDVQIRLTAVVRDTDRAIDEVCVRHGIRVFAAPRPLPIPPRRR